MTPAFVDDRLVIGWMAELQKTRLAPIPVNLIERWQAVLLAAVQEAREPVPTRLTGRYAGLDQYMMGIAAGLAAGLATSPASDGGDSDPIILAAGLLAGSASLEAAAFEPDYEVVASRAAAAAVVDSASSGAGLIDVIQVAVKAAARVRSRSMVGVALTALEASVIPAPWAGQSLQQFEIRLVLEPTNLLDDINEIELFNLLKELGDTEQWITEDTGHRFVLVTSQPGPLIEALWSYGRVRNLQIRYLPND